MSQTTTENVQLTDGRELRLTVAEPDGVVRGGIVVLHEARGVTDTVHRLLGSFADEGWLAVAPHIYRETIGSAEVAGAEVAANVEALTGESVLADTDATCMWLGQRDVADDRVGVIGFDLGGAVALVVAANRTVGAAVSVAAPGILQPISTGLPALVDVAGELSCPWLGIFADRDARITADEVDKLRESAEGSEAVSEVVRLAGADNRFDTDPDSAEQAWHRTVNWFDSHLR